MVGKEIYVLDQLTDNVGVTVGDVLELVTCSGNQVHLKEVLGVFKIC